MPGLEDKSVQLSNKGLKGQESLGDTGFSQAAFDAINELIKSGNGAKEASTTFADPNDYYGKGLVSKDITPDEAQQFGGLDELAAQNQSGAKLVGNSVGQILTETVLGTLEGIGYIPEMTQLFDEELAAQKGFGNAWTEFFKDAKESINDEAFPIYKTQAAQDFAPSDATWWAGNAATLGTAMSLMLPSMGVAKLASYAGKSMALAPKIAGVAGKLGIIDDLIGGSKAIAKFGNAAIPALYSRYTENFLEANGKFEESMDYYLGKGLSEDEARKRAGREAADTWKGNALLMPLDFLQYSSMMKGIDGFMGTSKAITNSLGKRGSQALNFTSQMSSEALEEGFQYVAGKEAESKERKGTSFFDGSFMSRLSDYVDDPELQTSMFWGAAGGGIFAGVGPAANKLGDRVMRSKLAYDAKKITAAHFKDAESFNKTSNDELLELLSRKTNLARTRQDDVAEAILNFANEVDVLKSSVVENAEESPESSKATINRLDKFSSRLRKFSDKFDQLDKSEVFKGNDALKLEYLSAQMQLDVLEEDIKSKANQYSTIQNETNAPQAVLNIIDVKAAIQAVTENLEEALNSGQPHKNQVIKSLNTNLKGLKLLEETLLESYITNNEGSTKESIGTSRDVELMQAGVELHKLESQKKDVLSPRYKALQQMDKESADKMADTKAKNKAKADTKTAEDAGATATSQEEKDIAKHKASKTNNEADVDKGDNKATVKQVDNVKKATATTETIQPNNEGGNAFAEIFGEREFKDPINGLFDKNPKAFKKLKNDLEPLLNSITTNGVTDILVSTLLKAKNSNEFNNAYNDIVQDANDAANIDAMELKVELVAILDNIDAMVNNMTKEVFPETYEDTSKTVIPSEPELGEGISRADLEAELGYSVSEEIIEVVPPIIEQIEEEPTLTRADLTADNSVNFDPKNLNLNFASDAWFSRMYEYAIKYNALEARWELEKDNEGNPIRNPLDADPTLNVDFDALDNGLIEPNDEIFYTINPSSPFTKEKFADKYRIQTVINARKADGTTYVIGVLSDVSNGKIYPASKFGFDLSKPRTKQSFANQRAFRDAVWSHLEDSGLMVDGKITSTNVITLPKQFNTKVKEILPGKLNKTKGNFSTQILLDKYGDEFYVGHVFGATGDQITVNGNEGLDVRAQDLKNGHIYALLKHPSKNAYVPVRMDRIPVREFSDSELQPIINNLVEEILEDYTNIGNLSNSISILKEYFTVKKAAKHIIKIEEAKTTNEYHNVGDVIIKFFQKEGNVTKPLSMVVESNNSPYLINLTKLKESGFNYDSGVVDAPSIQFIKSNMDFAIDYKKLNVKRGFTPFNREEGTNYNEYVAKVTRIFGININKPFIMTNILVDNYMDVNQVSEPILTQAPVLPKEAQPEVKEVVEEDTTKVVDKTPTNVPETPIHTAEDAPSSLGDINLDDIGGSYKGNIITDNNEPVTKLADDTTKVWDKAKETSWFKERFPNIPVTVLEDIKEIISKGGDNAWAIYKNAAIHIYENAGMGTLYHEAFHVVFDLSLGSKLKDQLYKEAKSKYSISKEEVIALKDRYKKSFNKELTDSRAEELVLEEKLADDFQEYMISNEENNSLGRKILNFFKRLLDGIKSVFTGNISINNTFYDINAGKYNTSKLSKAEISKFANGLPKTKVSTWSTRKTNLVVSNINNRLFNYTLPKVIRKERPGEFDGIADEEMLVSLIRDIGTEQLYLYLYKDIVLTIGNNLKFALLNSTNTSKEVKNVLNSDEISPGKLFSYTYNESIKLQNYPEFKEPITSANIGINVALKIYNQPVGKFGELIPELEKGLTYYGIVIKNKSVNKLLETSSEVEDSGVELGREEAWMRDVSLRSTKESASFAIKKYIRGLIKVDATGSRVKDETGIFDTTYVNYDETYDTLMKDLSNSIDINDMINTINDLTVFHPHYEQIYQDIINDENLKNTFWNTFNQPARRKLYISNSLKDGSNRFFIGESNRKNIVSSIIESWYDGVLTTNKLVREVVDLEGNTSTVVDKDLAIEVHKNFMRFKSIKDTQGLSDTLALIGINIPKEVFDDQKTFGYNVITGRLAGLLSAFKDGSNPFDKSSSNYNSKSLRTAANYVKKSIIVNREQSYTNINGDKVYSHTTPNYNISFFNKLRKLPAETIDFYINKTQGDVIYIEGATWMHDIADGITDVNEVEYFELDGISLKEGISNRYEDLTLKNLQIATLNLFANNSNQEYAYYRGPVPADSSTVAVVKNKKLTNKEALVDLAKVANAEYKRIKNIEKRLADSTIPKIVNYDTKTNASLNSGFKFLPNFNKLDNALLDYHFGNLNKAKDSIDYKDSSKWIKDQISNYVVSELSSYKESLKDSGVVSTDKSGREILEVDSVALTKAGNIDAFLSNFYHNHLLAQSQIILMTVGDPAYYKGNKGNKANVSVDFQKRSKETVSPKKNANLDAIWVDKDGKEHAVKHYINNSQYNYIILGDKMIKSSANELIYNALRQDLPEAEAKLRASKYGYKVDENPVNVTDAQTFITLDFYKATMISHDRWNQTLENAYNVLKDSNGTAHDIRVIMQPFKPFMYGHNKMVNNGSSNIIVPTQHKNSEFLLLPQFVDKANSELKDVFKFMQENNVHSVSFDSAVKVGAQNIQEVGSNLSSEKINQANFTDRGIQQDVPAHHIDDNNIFGTQIRKLILANLQQDVDYNINEFGSSTPITKKGKELFDLYHELITANIKESFEKVNSEFSDITKLRDFLIEQAEARGNADELRKALEIVDINGEQRFKLPLFFPTFGKQVESLIISIYKNNVVKQKIKGGAFVQLSSFGFDDSLEIKFNDKHEVEYMQVKLPWWSSKLPDKYIMQDDNISDQFIKDYPDLFDAIGYRIPTEDKYSMVPIKVVGFLPTESGGAIMLPPEITTISGSDFDIDKLYVMLPEFKETFAFNSARKKMEAIYNEAIEAEKIEDKGIDTSFDNLQTVVDMVQAEQPLSTQDQYLYDLFKTMDGKGLFDEFKGYSKVQYKLEEAAANQSRKSRNNMLLNIMRGVLTNSATTTALMSPGGFDTLKEYAKVVDGVYGDSSIRGDLMLPQTMDSFTIDNLVAKKLIGVAANHNAVRSILENSSLSLTKPLLYGGQDVANFNNQTTLDGAENINKNLAYFLAAVVDAAKDPVINKVNYNFYTANTISVMVHLGLPLKTALDFNNTNFVRKLTELGLNNPKDARVYLDNIKVGAKTLDIDFKEYNSIEKLNALPEDVLAKTFKQIKGAAEEFSKLVRGIGADRLTTLGPTLANNINVLDSLPFNEESGIGNIFVQLTNTESLLDNNPAFAAFTKYGLQASSDKLSENMPYLKYLYNNARQKIADNLVGKFLTTKDINYINSELNSFLFTNNSLYQLSNNEKIDLVSSLNREFAELKKKYPKEFGENKIIAYLAFDKIKHNNSEVNILTFNNSSSYSAEQKNDIRNSVKDLFESDKVDIREAAKKLIQYSFIVSGFTYSNTSLFGMFPTEVFTDYLQEANDFSKFSYGLMDVAAFEDEGIVARFKDQFLRNNYKKFTYRLNEDSKFEVVKEDVLGVVELNLIDLVNTNGKSKPEFVFNTTKKGKDVLYMKSLTGSYVRTNSLGFGNDLHEYNFTSNIINSIWKVNNNVNTAKVEAKVIPTKSIKSTESDTEFAQQGGGNSLANMNTSVKTINVYWGQAESSTSTRILSNLAPRKFTWKGREYGSVEHAYQSNKSGTFDQITYNAYNNIGGYGKKIRGKGTINEMKNADSLGLIKKLVVESFIQNPNSEASKKLVQYNNFTHNTDQLIDKAFLEGLQLARKELLNIINNTIIQPTTTELTDFTKDGKDVVYQGKFKFINGDITNIQNMQGKKVTLSDSFINRINNKLAEFTKKNC